MQHRDDGRVAIDQHESWPILAADGNQLGGELVSSPVALLSFLGGWLVLGAAIAVGLVRRGHDWRVMLLLGAGLGPLMLLVAVDTVRRREREAVPVVLASGVDHGGELDVLVLIDGRPEDVRFVAPTLEAIASHVRTLTLGRAVEYECMEGAVADERRQEAETALVAASELVPIRHPSLVMFPGRPAAAAEKFAAARATRTLVLHAFDETTAS